MIRWMTLIALAGACSLVSAQGRFDDVEVRTQELASGLYMLQGAGGNLALVVGDDKTFMVDDDFGELSEKIAAAVAAVSDKPVSFVLNTHWHGDHSGGNENFARAGAVIVAHDNVRQRMSREHFNEIFDRKTPASPPAALPVVTFADDLRLHLSGKTIEARHLPGAHTDGDAAVLFVEDNVLHTGDLYFNGMYPFVDITSGGSIRGLIDAVGRMLEWTDSATRIIPGHGALSNRDELRAYRDFLTTVADAIDALIAEGRSEEEVIAAKPTADFDATMNRLEFFKPDQWVSLIYKDLTRADD